MWLPTEGDWNPQLSNKDSGDNEYEEHVKLLTKQLHEANKVAGQQSKLSHETAKRYYDRQAKIQQFNKGEFVYIHDHTHERYKARKFSY